MCDLCKARQEPLEPNIPATQMFLSVTGLDDLAVVACCETLPQADRDIAAGAYGKGALGITKEPRGHFPYMAGQPTMEKADGVTYQVSDDTTGVRLGFFTEGTLFAYVTIPANVALGLAASLTNDEHIDRSSLDEVKRFKQVPEGENEPRH